MNPYTANWKLLADPWVVGIGGSLLAAGIAWLLKRLLSRPATAHNGRSIQQSASPTMTQTFRPVINIGIPVKIDRADKVDTPEIDTGPALVWEDGMLWRAGDGKHLGPYCPTCFEANGKTISLIAGATRGTYSCPIHKTSFWTQEFRDRFGTERDAEKKAEPDAGHRSAMSKPAQFEQPAVFADVGRTALRFSTTKTVAIGSGVGKEAHLIRLDNTERTYNKILHGVNAQLTFTHLHTGEVFKKTGWFAEVDKGHVENVDRTISLSAKDQSYVWLILYVVGHLPEFRGQYWFAGPQGDTALEEWTLFTHSNQRLTFGKWSIHISISCDGSDAVELDVELQAEG